MEQKDIARMLFGIILELFGKTFYFSALKPAEKYNEGTEASVLLTEEKIVRNMRT